MAFRPSLAGGGATERDTSDTHREVGGGAGENYIYIATINRVLDATWTVICCGGRRGAGLPGLQIVCVPRETPWIDELSKHLKLFIQPPDHVPLNCLDRACVVKKRVIVI